MIVHGTRYDYSMSVYRGSQEIIYVGCPIHGVIPQQPRSHLKGKGCKRCGAMTANNHSRKTTLQFLSEAAVVHVDR